MGKLTGVPVARVVVLHPHPSMGGDSSHPLVQQIAAGLNSAGIEAITPDINNPDVAAATLVVAELAGDGPVAVIGYSWGSVVASHAAPVNLVARVLIAPPSSMPLGETTVPQLMLVPENDQFGGPDAFAGASIEIIPGEDHFLWGSIDAIAKRSVDFVLNL